MSGVSQEEMTSKEEKENREEQEESKGEEEETKEEKKESMQEKDQEDLLLKVEGKMDGKTIQDTAHNSNDTAIDDDPPLSPSPSPSQSRQKPNGLITPYYDLLKRNRNYRLLFFSNIISEIGNWFNTVATLAILNNVSGSTMAITLNGILSVIPPLFFGMFIGLFLDRINRRQAMISTSILRGILVLFSIFCQTKETLPIFYSLIFLRYSFNSIFLPARTSIVPSVVDPDDLMVANGLDGIVWSSMIFIGAALGGLGTALVGITGSFILDSLAYFGAAYVVGLINKDVETMEGASSAKIPGWLDPFKELFQGFRYLLDSINTIFCCCCYRWKSSKKHPLETKQSMQHLMGEIELDDDEEVEEINSMNEISFEPLKDQSAIESQPKPAEEKKPMTCLTVGMMYLEGFRFLRTHKYILATCFVKGCIWLPIGIVNLMNIRFAQTEFVIGEGGTISVGITYMVIGIGTMITPILSRKFGKDTPRGHQIMILLAFLQIFIGCLCLAFSVDFVTFLLANLVRSGGTSMGQVYSSLILQQLTPKEIRGRIFSLELMLHTLANCSGQLFAGYVTDFSGWTLRDADLVAGIEAGVILAAWVTYYSCAKKHFREAYPREQSAV